MGDNRRLYRKLVKATLTTIVMLGHHGRSTVDIGSPIMGLFFLWCPVLREYILFKFPYPIIIHKKYESASFVLKMISIYCLTVDKWRPSWILTTGQCPKLLLTTPLDRAYLKTL